MKFKMLLTGILSSLIAISSMSSANPNHQRHANFEDNERQQPNAKMIMRHLSKLDLSDSQNTEIEALVIEGIESTKAQRENLKAMHHQMKALMVADTVDETAIKSISMEIANIKSDLTIARLNNRHQIEALLSEEQKGKMDKMRQHRQYKKGRY